MVITGEIDLRGDEFEISAIALDGSNGKVLAKSEVSVANKQEILGSLPKLVVPIRKALGDSTPPSVQFNEVSGGFKAASLEAVHQDAIGVDEQFAGKFQEAFDSFQKASQLDPNFARAYTGMAAMDENLGKQEDAIKYMKLAMEHVDSMTEREPIATAVSTIAPQATGRIAFRNTLNLLRVTLRTAWARTTFPSVMHSCATPPRLLKPRNEQWKLFPWEWGRG